MRSANQHSAISWPYRLTKILPGVPANEICVTSVNRTIVQQ